MDIKRMREYVKLCETFNFTKAAQELCLSQSTLPKHVSQIEDELESQLIVRSTHEAALTAEGELTRSAFEGQGRAPLSVGELCERHEEARSRTVSPWCHVQRRGPAHV